MMSKRHLVSAGDYASYTRYSITNADYRYSYCPQRSRVINSCRAISTLAVIKYVYVFDMNTWLAVPNALRSHSSAHVGVIGGLVRKRERLRTMSATLCFLVIQRIHPHFLFNPTDKLSFLFTQRINHDKLSKPFEEAGIWLLRLADMKPSLYQQPQ